MDYEKQAQDFLKKTNTSFKAEFKEHNKHFANDKEERDIYIITLKRGNREYKFNFGQSLDNSGFKIINLNNNKEIRYVWQQEALMFAQGNKQRYKQVVRNKLTFSNLKIQSSMKTPTAYDVLASLTTYEPEDFNDFCDSFGYDTDSRTAERIYNAVKEEYNNLKMLFSDEELELMQEIQ